jgi:predicted 3-demethylubiquinone-9 3-methyltransferase (glyoxalase superfamily)
MLVEFDLDSRPFTALNGGPIFKFSEAVSFQVRCKDQKEVDYHWRKLGAGGDPVPGLRLAQGQVRPRRSRNAPSPR